MKKIFSMLLMAVVMVSTFTGCKSEDEEQQEVMSTASKMAGSYTDDMSYTYGIQPIGKQEKVTVNVTVADANHVNIEIPEIKELSFTVPMGQGTIDITVEDYGKYTITNVPVVENNGLIIASKMTSATGLTTFSDIFNKYPFDFDVKDVAYKMNVGGRDMSGKAVVSGQIIAIKADGKLAVIYDFYPAEALKSMGISIGGILGIWSIQ